MEENQKNSEKKKIFDCIKDFLKSPFSIILVLMIFSMLLMIYNRYLIKVSTLYNYSGYDKNFTILNGSIYSGFDINYFGDSKIIYNGEDIKLIEFKIGYYIKDKNNYITISEITKESDKETSISLKEIISSSDFSFTEVHRKATFMSKENLEKIEGLIFKINGKDESEKEVNIEIPLDVVKITK